MKGKITKMKPDEVCSLKYKESKLLLKKDLSTLASIPEGASFFIQTDFKYSDDDSKPLLVLSEFKSTWKNYVKEAVKPPHKTTALGNCTLSDEGKTLTLIIQKGKAKPMAIEKALKKAKLLPTSIDNVLFKEIPILEENEQVDALDDAEEGKDRIYNQIITAFKIYKGIALDESDIRLAQIQGLDDLIAKWQKKNLPIKDDDDKGKARNEQLSKLRSQLYSHRISINVKNRKGAEPIKPIEDAWKKYKSRPEVKGIEALEDFEDRIDTLTDIDQEITGWYERNQPEYSPEEEELKKALDLIKPEVDKEILRLKGESAKVRKDHVKFMVEKLTSATKEEKEKLAKDDYFMFELSRTVPVSQINDARKLLGLEPVTEVVGGPSPEAENAEAWKDPEILAVFKDFAKFTTFEVAVDHKSDPGIEKTVKLIKGTWIWKATETAAKKFQLNKDFYFILDSEDGSGNTKLKINTKPSPTYYYCVKTDIASQTHYEVLKADTKLFPETPSKSHVLQGNLGDCYLFAAITSLVHKDPNLIIDMMMDKGETVTVRLFDVKEDAVTKAMTYTAQYINVKKSIVKTPDGDDDYAQKYLWVQLIEKAYAAGGFSGTYFDQKNNANAGETYKDMAGGLAVFAYQVLTGKPSELLTNFIASPVDYAVTDVPVEERGKHEGNRTVNIVNLPWGTAEKAILAAPGPNYAGSKSYEIFGKNKTNTIKWYQFVLGGSLTTLFNREFSGDYQGEVTLDDFELIFQGKMKDAEEKDVTGLPVLDAKLAKTMMDWLKAEKLFPGKRGAGIYSKLQLNMFKNIKDALDSKKLVGLSSKKEVGRTADGTGHSAGESVSGGLVGGHAYTVLDTRENDPTKELEIRNPWGQRVQKNVTVADLVIDTDANLTKVLTAETVKLTKEKKAPLVKKALELKEQHEKAVAGAAKDQLKLDLDAAKLEVAKVQKKIDDMLNVANKLKYKNKLFYYKDQYDKVLANLELLKRKDQTALVSKEVTQADGQEGGEFWLLLEDLTLRFKRIHIG